MAKQTVNIGAAANDGTGDTPRTAFDKVNDNFVELYNSVGADVGDANVTLTVGSSSKVARYNTTLTANRTVTLSTSGAYDGAEFAVVRNGLGAFTVSVGGLIVLRPKEWAKVVFDGTAGAWVLAGSGRLTKRLEFNVLDYGATGDGTTDDKDAIQAAIDACFAAGGGIVYLPPGTYVVNSPLVLPKTGVSDIPSVVVSLKGAGNRVTVIKGGTLSDGEAVIKWPQSVSRAWSQTIEDMTIRCADVANTYAIHYPVTAAAYNSHDDGFAEILQLHMRDVVIRASCTYIHYAIKLDGFTAYSSFENITLDPKMDNSTYSVVLFKTPYNQTIAAGWIFGTDTGFNYSTFKDIIISYTGGGWAAFIDGRMYGCSVENLHTAKGAIDDPNIMLEDSCATVFVNVFSEGRMESPQIKITDSKYIRFTGLVMGVPGNSSVPGAPTDYGNGIELYNSTDCVFEDFGRDPSNVSWDSTYGVDLIVLDSNSHRNKFLNVGLSNDDLPSVISDSGKDNYVEAFDQKTANQLPYFHGTRETGLVYDVRRYGAKANGTTDDVAAIQAAIDAASTAGGGIVYFPAGTYAIGSGNTTSGAIKMATSSYSNITLSGYGAILKSTNVSNHHTIAIGNTSTPTNVIISGLRFNENATVRGVDDGSAIYIFKGSVMIRDCYIENLAGRGVQSLNTSDVICENNIVTGATKHENGCAFYVEGGVDFIARGNRVLNITNPDEVGGSAAQGFYVRNYKACLIDGNHIDQTETPIDVRADVTSGSIVAGESIGAIVRGNTIHGGSTLASFIAGLTLRTFTGRAIRVANDSGNTRVHRNVVVANNTIVNWNGDTGIICPQSNIKDCVITGNTISSRSGDTMADGIRLCGSGHIVTSNVIDKGSGTLNDGIDMDTDGATGCLINNNTIISATTPYNIAAQITFTNGDTTPSVKNYHRFTEANSGGTSITTLDDGVESQMVTIVFTTANTTIKDASTTGNFQLSGGADWNANANDTLTVIKRASVWYEVARSAN